MSDDKEITNITPEDSLNSTVANTNEVFEPAKKLKKTFSFVGKEKDKRERSRGRSRGERGKSDLGQSMISIRRVARVVAGGRRFSFSVAIVAGDKNGKVGVGLGKAGDTTLAIDKALKHAKKNMISVPLNKKKSISTETKAKFGSSIVYIKPAPGRGLVAGSSVRTVLDLAGVTDVNAKIISRSKNHLNNARATIAALTKLRQ